MSRKTFIGILIGTIVFLVAVIAAIKVSEHSTSTANQSVDGLPIHDLGEQGMVVSRDDNSPFNRYITGKWTCVDSEDPTHPRTDEVTYTGGNTLSTGAFHDVAVDGEKLSGSIGDKAVIGSFTSPTTLELNVQPKDGSSASENIRCWQQ